MKVTRQQLKRIIKEEKKKILREGVTQEDALLTALQDYVIALSDQMPSNDIMDFKPDALAFVEGWFEDQANAEEWDEADQGYGQ
jgi:hypothetical protein